MKLQLLKVVVEGNFLWLIWSIVDMPRAGMRFWNADEERDQRQHVVVYSFNFGWMSIYDGWLY